MAVLPTGIGPVTGYNIERSLRFNSADSAYLNRTPASAGNRKTWTWSGWIKRSSAKYSLLFAAGNTNDIWNSVSTTQIGWAANTDSISVYDNGTYFRTTTQVFRDFSAWGHLVVAIDTTQATAANRVKMYWNGVEITAFSTSNNPTQNADTFVNAAHNHVIGGQQTNVANAYYNGYMTEVNFIDGQALTPSSFGETDASTGVWKPKKYAGTYGTNGFYLPFSNNSSVGTIGADASAVSSVRVNTGRGAGSATTTSSVQLFSNNVLQTSSGGALFGSSGTFTPLDKDFTVEIAIRPTTVGVRQLVLYNGNSAGSDNSGTIFLELTATNTIRASTYTNGTYSVLETSTTLSANNWYHIAFVRSGSTAKLYVNGTSYATGTLTGSGLAAATTAMYIGDASSTSGWAASFAGQIANVRFTIGVARYTSNYTAPSSQFPIGSADPYWGEVVGLLPFNDSNGSSSFATYWSNYWNANNFSVTAGAGNDSLVDTPTPYGTDTGAGGEVRGNYCTWNPLDKNATVVTANGNLDANSGAQATAHRLLRSTLGALAKSYFEITTSGGTTGMVNILGAAQQTSTTADGVYVGSFSKSFGMGYATNAGAFYQTGVTQVHGAATALVDGTWGIAIDPVNGNAWMRNSSGNWIGGGDPAAGTFPTWQFTPDGNPWFPVISFYNIATTFTATLNAGQRPFAYTAPSGFKALCTQNLPTPTIGATSTTTANKYMNAVLYTGNGSSQTVTGFGFNPDMMWGKGRSVAYSQGIVDVVRGDNNLIFTDTTGAEQNPGAQFALATDGATVTYRSANWAFNQNAATYVIWGWKANGAGVTNTAGTITSTVSANTTSGFSIVTYTGTGANATVGHGLGVAPKMVIVKRRSTSGSNWITYHSSLANASGNYLSLNTTDAATNDNTAWNNTNPTSSVFSLGTLAAGNLNTGTFVAYCFAEVAGYSKFGSYTGNGSTDGPFVFCGFRPRYVMIKKSSAAGDNWVVIDTARDIYNTTLNWLYPNVSDAEVATTGYIDILSNGFKIRNAGSYTNTSSATYIYAAFAESPFKYSLAR